MKLHEAGLAFALFLAGCAAPNSDGIPRGVSFQLQPIYPRGYDITACASRHLSPDELQAAWKTKATELAMGRKFKISNLTVHATERVDGIYTPYGSIPIVAQGQTATGTLTILQ